MGKRKVFIKTDLGVPQIEYSRDIFGVANIAPETFPIKDTNIKFSRNETKRRNFDFVRWYDVGIDSITYACQRQIERFLDGQDRNLSVATISGYCQIGIPSFLDFCALQASALGRELTIKDLERPLIDGYLNHLSASGKSYNYQRIIYTTTKAVLSALGDRGIIPVVKLGDAATFPENVFPCTQAARGEEALSKRERLAFSTALKQAINPIWTHKGPLNSTLLSYALFAVALHTGCNTTPLLEMDRNCLVPHPKDNITFLVLYKRRGHKNSKVALRSDEEQDSSTVTVHPSIERLIRKIEELTKPIRDEAPEDIKDHLWLHRPNTGRYLYEATTLESTSLARAMKGLVKEYGLTDSAGAPLRINISRLRKTFANRIFELTGGDLVATAAALGNTPRVADQHYLAPNLDTLKNWRFMGKLLIHELTTKTIGATYRDTPTGRCADPINGQYAPMNGSGATCMNFMNCLRCKHYAVTAEDLYKVFSFYFRVLSERTRMDKRRWAREFSHIPRLIDQYIIAEGLKRGIFKIDFVNIERERARTQPHPFWSVDLISSLEIIK